MKAVDLKRRCDDAEVVVVDVDDRRGKEGRERKGRRESGGFAHAQLWEGTREMEHGE